MNSRTYGNIAVLLTAIAMMPRGIAADTPPPPPPEQLAAVKHESLPPSSLRDPFWPAGWRPPSLGHEAAVADDLSGLIRWEEAEKMLQVSGLSRKANGQYVAILEKAGLVENGDAITIKYMGLTYQWRVIDITKEGLHTERISVTR